MNFIGENISNEKRCYLCNETVNRNDKLLSKQLEDSLAVLSSILGLDIKESHSKILCTVCNDAVLEYELLEQRYNEMRYHILTTYNRTAKLNNLKTVTMEISGVLESLSSVSSPNHSIIKFGSIQEQDIDEESIYECELIKEKCIKDEMENNSNIVEHVENVQLSFPLSCDPNNFNVFNINEYKPEEKTTSQNAGILITLPAAELEFENIDDEDIIIYDQMIDQTSSSNENDENSQSDLIYNIDSSTVDSMELFATQAESQQSPLFEQFGDSYQCITCSSGILDVDSFAVHLQNVHKAQLFNCNQCDAIFLSEQQVQQHMLTEHNNSTTNQHKCEACSIVFKTIQEHTAHNCSKQQKCNKKYQTKNLLDKSSEDRPHKCPKCPKNFASKYTLSAHLKIHTERSRPYKCNKCEKTFLNSHNLARHQKFHLGEKLFDCDACGKAFGTKHNLELHKIAHSGTKLFLCEFCSKSFTRKAELKDHERVHTGEKPFKCDMCDKSFSQRSNLSSHRKSTHLNEKQHQCKECDKSFKRRRLLEYHIQAIHTGERPFKCNICAAGFVYPEHYKKHIRIHSGQKPYSCEVCGKQFSSRDNRNAHRYIHSVKKPYECTICKAGFMRKPLLLTHLKQTGHGNDKTTITVNQPHIPGSQIEENDVDYAYVDKDEVQEAIEYVLSSNNSNEMPDTIMQPTTDIFNQEDCMFKEDQVIYKYMELDDLLN